MNNLVAEPLLQQELDALSSLGYKALCNLVNHEPIVKELRGPDGQTYQIEIQVVWDGETNGPIRLLAGIDDGGWSAFLPLTLDEIVPPS